MTTLQEEQQNYQNKMQLSLAALLFFAPFVDHSLSVKSVDLNQEEKDFVQGYVRFGYGTIFLLICAVVFAVIEYFYVSDIVYRLSTISSVMLLGCLIIGCIGIFANISLFSSSHAGIQSQLGEEVHGDRGQIFLSFLPIYNVYRRYSLQSFQHPYRWIKESLLWRTAFIVIGLLVSNTSVLSLVVVCIIIRCVMLVGGIDSIPNTFKQKLNALFLINPEEIRGYITGTLIYVFHRRSENIERTWNQCVVSQKSIYEHNYMIYDSRCRIEYGIAIGIILGWVITTGWIYYNTLWIQVVPLIFLIARYVIMGYISGALPPLPIIHEFVETVKYLYHMYHKNAPLSGIQGEGKK